MEQKEKRSKVILTIIFGLTLVITIAGASFAYLATVVYGNEYASSVLLKSSTLSIAYDSGLGIIAVTPAIEPGWTQTKTFTVTNTGNDAAPYSIVWTNITNDFAIPSELTYSVAGTVTTGTGSAGNLSVTMAPTANGNMISGLVINEGATHTYTLTMKFANPAVISNENQGKIFAGRIEIR